MIVRKYLKIDDFSAIDFKSSQDDIQFNVYECLSLLIFPLPKSPIRCLFFIKSLFTRSSPVDLPQAVLEVLSFHHLQCWNQSIVCKSKVTVINWWLENIMNRRRIKASNLFCLTWWIQEKARLLVLLEGWNLMCFIAKIVLHLRGFVSMFKES